VRRTHKYRFICVSAKPLGLPGVVRGKGKVAGHQENQRMKTRIHNPMTAAIVSGVDETTAASAATQE
jgi:hypothetical protein